MNLRLTGKVALVTGAGKGIGAAVALMLAEEGAAVVINYLHSAAEALLLVDRIRQSGGRAISYQADVSKLAQVQAMVQAALAEYGQLDILVNNAGFTTHTRTIEGTTAEDIEKCMAVNVIGILNCVKAVAPHMKERRYGKIVNVVSYRAYAPQVPSPYGTTKGAALILSVEIAQELAPYNINVVSVSPGMVATDMLKGRAQTKEAFQEMESHIPIGRMAVPADIAHVICFLASDCARHITGTDILITGGEMYRW